MIKFRAVKLKHHDTCLTYVLKRLGFEGETWFEMSGYEFFTRFKTYLTPITEYNIENTHLKEGDIIISKSKKDKVSVICAEIDESGRTFMSERIRGFHFFLCEGAYISDCYGGLQNGICLRSVQSLSLQDSENDYFILKFGDYRRFLSE